MIRTVSLALLVFAIAFGALQAQEPIRFARTPAVSPDGKLVAFSYLGDIWLVGPAGGVATPLTMHEKHDFNPVFSPDGKWIAFSSNRHGQYDVFVVPVKGGRPRRLTSDSADDHVTGWSPDSRHILFMSSREADFPAQAELYSVPLAGGAARRISAHEGREGVYSPNGKMIAYVRGPGFWYRKGYLGSSNDDIWICNEDGGNNRRITVHQGQDTSPMWGPKSEWLYYVSDCLGGLANVVKLPLDPESGNALPGKPAPQMVTKHKDESVRRAQMSANGEVIVYECGADIWLHSVADGKSRKLKIEVNADDKANPETITTFTSGATEFALSPNERFIAFVVHGEIFLTTRDGGKAKRLTDNPGFDHGIAWSPDSKKILFLSDRNGQEDIYLLESNDPDHPDLVQAHRFKVKQITNTPEAEQGINFAPDGKRVAFLRAGKLMTMNPDGSNEKVLVAEGQVFDYDWSPDSKWIAYARMDGSFASELFIIPAGGGTLQDPPRNVTRFATYNGGVTWSRSGSKLAFVSQRRGNNLGAFVLSLQKLSVTGAAPSGEIDWENIHLRVKQPTTMNTTECAISPQGNMIAFRGVSDDTDDLWIANTDGGSVTRLSTGNLRPAQIQWSRLFTGQILFRDAAGNLRSTLAGATAPLVPNKIPFTAKMSVRQEEVFLEMFDQSWRALNENFYDAKFHGINWNDIRTRYRPLVRHCAMKEDLYALISLMFGELNASHLGISGNPATPDEPTAYLGLLFNRNFAAAGLEISEVVKNGPADRRGLALHAHDVIVSIDETELTPDVELSRLLNGKVGEFISLMVASGGDRNTKRRVEIRGESRTKMSELLYERWIARNAERVAKVSKGKLGYIHIPNMTEPGLERFVRALYSDNFDKDGIVLDVRYNGGGFTHDQVLNYLTGKEHTIFTHRDGSAGLVLRSHDRKWTKPLTLLINNRSFSDAEIFPHAFRTWGLGKLVGQPTGGFVIGTREVSLIDGSKFRTPRIGVHTIKGINMERVGVMPDVLIEPNPDELARGNDTQLDKAVEVLAQDVELWKKSRLPAPPTAVENASGAPKAGASGPR